MLEWRNEEGKSIGKERVWNFTDLCKCSCFFFLIFFYACTTLYILAIRAWKFLFLAQPPVRLDTPLYRAVLLYRPSKLNLALLSTQRNVLQSDATSFQTEGYTFILRSILIRHFSNYSSEHQHYLPIDCRLLKNNKNFSYSEHH